MALDQSALLVLVESMKAGDGGELMRRLLAAILQELVDAEATAVIGAGLHQRTETRTTQRNGTRDMTLTTGVGDVTVKVPKTRTGSFFPALLAPRRRVSAYDLMCSGWYDLTCRCSAGSGCHVGAGVAAGDEVHAVA